MSIVNCSTPSGIETVTMQTASLSPAFAVMVAVPSATAVITPLLSTDATLLFNVAHVMVSNARHTFWNVDGGEFFTITIVESIGSNTRQLRVFGNGDGGEAPAIIEGIGSDTRHIFRDGDGGKAIAFIESIVSNARHTISFATKGNC